MTIKNSEARFVQMASNTNDQDRLIVNAESANANAPTSQILLKYILWKLAPFIWILFSGIFIHSPSFIYFVSLIIVLIDIWLCRRLYSYPLIGLSWSLEMPDLHSSFEDLITFNIEPDPFVPSPTNSDLFWLFICGRPVIFLLITLMSLLRFQVFAFFMLLIVDGVEIFNLYLYFKCLSLSKKQSEDTFRSVMINAVHSEFLDAVPVIEENDSKPVEASAPKAEDKNDEPVEPPTTDKNDENQKTINDMQQETDKNEETKEVENA